MDALLSQEAKAHKDLLFKEFEEIRQLPDSKIKFDRTKQIYDALVYFKGRLNTLANDTIYSQEVRSELIAIITAVKLKINALENKYKAQKSFFKPNINSGFTVAAAPAPAAAAPTAAIAATAAAPTTPPTAVPSISITGGYIKRRKTRQRKTRRRKTRTSTL